ncbi:MAG: hypothetical protein U1E66_12835 [Rhodospirillales bacterium]
MGGLFKSPKTSAAQPIATVVASTPSTQSTSSTETDTEEVARRERVQALVQQRRNRASTIATSPRGLLIATSDLPVRKSLLGD